MDARLRSWLLDGADRPAGAEALLAADPAARALADDLAAIDAAAGALPPVPLPPGLAEQTLAVVLSEPGVLYPVAASTGSAAEAPATPKPANRPLWMGLVAMLTVAAAALIVVPRLGEHADRPDEVGDPTKFVSRGDAGTGEVGLSMAVQGLSSSTEGRGEPLPGRPSPSLGRYERGHAYAAGDTLLFRYEATSAGTLSLVRVDANGAQVLHQQAVQAGEGDLTEGSSALGYELEPGESAAVFALLSSPKPLSADEIAGALRGPGTADATPDPADVCARARSLGAACAAERVEGVR